jgi:hypothetical protein
MAQATSLILPVRSMRKTLWSILTMAAQVILRGRWIVELVIWQFAHEFGFVSRDDWDLNIKTLFCCLVVFFGSKVAVWGCSQRPGAHFSARFKSRMVYQELPNSNWIKNLGIIPPPNDWKSQFQQFPLLTEETKLCANGLRMAGSRLPRPASVSSMVPWALSQLLKFGRPELNRNVGSSCGLSYTTRLPQQIIWQEKIGLAVQHVLSVSASRRLQPAHWLTQCNFVEAL